MRSLFAFIGAALVAFLALGWFLDWYKVSSTPTDGGRRQVNFNLNVPKIGEDLKKGEQKALQVIEKVSKKEKPDNTETKKPAEGTEAKKPVIGPETGTEASELVPILPNP